MKKLRYVKSNIDMQGPNIDEASMSDYIVKLIEQLETNEVDDIDLKLLNSVYDEYMNDRDKFQGVTEPWYDGVKGAFYRKYIDLYEASKPVLDNLSYGSGYHPSDMHRILVYDKLRDIEYVFPKGWKQFAKMRYNLV